MDFFIQQEMTTRAYPNETVIYYGGCATDLDGDSDIDIVSNNATSGNAIY